MVPYFIAFLLNQSMIADIFSLVLFAMTIYLLKIPVRILRIIFKIKNTEDILYGLKNRRWLGWWLSPSIFGATSYLYFILVKNNVLFITSIGSPYLQTILILIFWWIITLILFTFLLQICWKEYLRNVLHIGDDVIKKMKISVVQWTRTQNFLVKELGLADFQTYERVIFSYSISLGLFALLSSIFFLGGDIILDIVMLVLVAYALLFDPASPFGKFDELFYKRLLSDLREAHRSSFMIALLILLALVGNDIVSLENIQLLPFLVRAISFFLALSIFFMRRKLATITRELPYLASFWIFLTDFLSTQSLTSAFGISLIPLTWYFLFSSLQIGIKDIRRTTAGKMIAYLTLSVVTSFISTIFLLMRTGSFLSFAFLIFAMYFVLSVFEKIIKSRKVLAQTKYRETKLLQETRISVLSLTVFSILMITYFYFFFFRNYQALLTILHTIYGLETLQIIFLKLVIPVIVLPFVLVVYFFLFAPYSKYILTTSDLLCHMGIINERIPLNTITSFEKEKVFRMTRRIPFIFKPGIVINYCCPTTWSRTIKRRQLVIFSSENFNRHLQEVSHRSFK